jgi:O-antigen/teichoic acid export membrane protein
MSTASEGVTRRIAGNAASLLVSRGAAMAVSFVFGVFVVRMLGVAEFGRYSVLMATYALLTIFVNLGLDSLVVREIARARSSCAPLFGSVLRLKLGSAGLCFFALAAGPAVIEPSRPLAAPLALVGICLLLDALTDSISLVFQGHERFGIPAALGLSGGVVFAGFGTVVLLAGGGVTALIASLAAAKTLQSVASWAAFKTKIEPLGDEGVGAPPRGVGSLIAAATPFFFAKLFYLVYFRIDMLMLDAIVGEESVGYYGAAYKFVNLATAAAGAFAAALFPVMAMSGIADRARFHRLFTDSLRYLTVIGLGIAVVAWYAAHELLVLLFTNSYAPAAPALRVLSWTVVAVFANLVFSNALISLDRERWAVPVGAMAVAANVGLNLLLIPRLAETGAAIATLAAEALVALLYAALLLRGEIASAAGAMAIRLLPCAAVLVLPPLLLREFAWPLPLVVAGSLYAVALYAAGLVRPRDLERLRAMLRGNGGDAS